MSGSEWTTFQDSVLHPALREAESLLSGPSTSNEEPFKSSYAAAEVLRRAQSSAEATIKSKDLSDSAVEAFRTAIAVLEARWGLILLDTDRGNAGEEAIDSSIKVLAGNPFAHILLLQDIFNRKGILWSRRDTKRSVEILQQAEELYNAWVASLPADSTSAPAADTLSGSGREQPESGLKVRPEVLRAAKDKFAHTLFYLAQIFGSTDEPDKAAYYCAGTLGLQLELGIQDDLEWTENCEQMATYYTNSRDIGVAEHLLHCADAVLAGSEGRGVDAAGLAERRASVALAWGKLISKRLSLSVKAKLRGDGGQSLLPKLQELPENVRYPQLQTPAPETLHWDGGLATTSDQAKELFNAAIPKLREALAYYSLEEHLIMHCNITLEISELYRWLADYETDDHRKCVLHKARAKRVEPLLAKFSRTDNPELYRTLQLDIGNAYKEITEIKFEAGRPFDKVAAAAKEAIPFYEGYVDAFRQENGSLPERIEDKDAAELFVNTVFYMARVISRLDPPVSSGNYKRTEHLRKAVVLYRYCAKFIQDNQIDSQRQLASTCLEMASLVHENAEMMRATAERQRRSAA